MKPEEKGSMIMGKTDLKVKVLSMRKKELQPTSPRNAKILLNTNKARVCAVSPFTIQLLIPTGE